MNGFPTKIMLATDGSEAAEKSAYLYGFTAYIKAPAYD
jgi:hypothetical protein